MFEEVATRETGSEMITILKPRNFIHQLIDSSLVHVIAHPPLTTGSPSDTTFQTVALSFRMANRLDNFSASAPETS
eukprot:8103049-Pyramimonas_sp.AAC.1